MTGWIVLWSFHASTLVGPRTKGGGPWYMHAHSSVDIPEASLPEAERKIPCNSLLVPIAFGRATIPAKHRYIYICIMQVPWPDGGLVVSHLSWISGSRSERIMIHLITFQDCVYLVRSTTGKMPSNG